MVLLVAEDNADPDDDDDEGFKKGGQSARPGGKNVVTTILYQFVRLLLVTGTSIFNHSVTTLLGCIYIKIYIYVSTFRYTQSMRIV